jgi:hypothetical protein
MNGRPLANAFLTGDALPNAGPDVMTQGYCVTQKMKGKTIIQIERITKRQPACVQPAQCILSE